MRIFLHRMEIFFTFTTDAAHSYRNVNGEDKKLIRFKCSSFIISAGTSEKVRVFIMFIPFSFNLFRSFMHTYKYFSLSKNHHRHHNSSEWRESLRGIGKLLIQRTLCKILLYFMEYYNIFFSLKNVTLVSKLIFGNKLYNNFDY